MFAFSTPESSGEIHAEMLAIEERFFESLGIPFRVLDIARATWAARLIASSTSKPGCPAAASTANTAK